MADKPLEQMHYPDPSMFQVCMSVISNLCSKKNVLAMVLSIYSLNIGRVYCHQLPVVIRATKELLTPDNKSHYLAIDTVGSKFLSPSRL